MTTDHRAEAEKHLANAARHNNEHPSDMRIAEVSAWIGTGYATLARDEEQATNRADMRDALTLLRRREAAMRDRVARHIANGLTSTNRDRWSAARSLAQDLDADGENDSKAAWAGSHLPDEPDPWAADPAVQKIQNFYRIASAHLAYMLLDPDDLGSKEWARRLTFALQNEGIDLTDAIRSRISDTTLGRNPSEPPF
ncbi:hypothetical protein OG552_10235 [Streptomyces sp. NBC_01476]|uniref:hypothetical protein n=1 Tax=Streptomyces sp. NBC_01476 TaxID=2903881 RepID=UPI002E2F422D|nr:hypothetical protein [Streptomyces sp. NBC_01476]